MSATATAATFGGKSLTLNGMGFLDQGALINNTAFASTIWSTPVSINSTTAINVTVAADILTISGVISNTAAGDLYKIGTGVVILNQVELYTGNTYIDGGTLDVNSANGFIQGTPNITVNNGATLELDNPDGRARRFSSRPNVESDAQWRHVRLHRQ